VFGLLFVVGVLLELLVFGLLFVVGVVGLLFIVGVLVMRCWIVNCFWRVVGQLLASYLFIE